MCPREFDSHPSHKWNLIGFLFYTSQIYSGVLCCLTGGVLLFINMDILNSRNNNIVKLYKDGYSMSQIARKFNISESTIVYWLDKKGIKRRSISEAVTSLYINKFNKKQFKLKNPLSSTDEKLKLACVMLYWGEGAKTRGTVKFANSDPKMIMLFLNFLRRICGISEERLKVLIHAYPDHDQNELMKFWMGVTKLPKSHFYRTHIHQGGSGSYKNKSQYGTLAVNYSDTKLFKIILEWIKEYQTELI